MTRRNARSTSRNALCIFAVTLLVIVCPLFVVACGSSRSPPSESSYDKVIGMQIGNTYSRVTFKDPNGIVHIFPDTRGSRNIPSWVHYGNNETLVGDAAKDAYRLHPKNTIFDVNYLLGMNIVGLSKRDIERWPFQVEDKSGNLAIRIESGRLAHHVTPQEVMAEIVKYLKKTAEMHLGEDVRYVVISVPSYFDDHQREIVKDSVKLAGLEPLRVVYDPTAAGIAHGLSESYGAFNILVYDLGGEALDVSTFFVEDGIFERLANISDHLIGGRHFNTRVRDYMLNVASEKFGVEIHLTHEASIRLDGEIEAAKRLLSTQFEARIEVPYLFGAKTMNETLTRKKFEELNADLLERSAETVEKVLKDSALLPENITTVILAGGSSHIPAVRRMIKTYFDQEPSSEVDLPEEAVIRGVAAQAGFLTYINDDILGCFEVAYASFGVATHEGDVVKMIPRFSMGTSRRSQIFTTVIDNQQDITVSIYEGEDIFAAGNRLVGYLEIQGLTRKPAGVPKIVVTLELDIYASEIKVDAWQMTSDSERTPGDKVWTSTFPLNNRDWIEANEKRLLEEATFTSEELAARRRSNLLSYLHGALNSLSSLTGSMDPSESKTRLLTMFQSGESWVEEKQTSARLEEIEVEFKRINVLLHPNGIRAYGPFLDPVSNPNNRRTSVNWDPTHEEL